MKDIQHDIFALQSEQEFYNLLFLVIIILGYVIFKLVIDNKE